MAIKNQFIPALLLVLLFILIGTFKTPLTIRAWTNIEFTSVNNAKASVATPKAVPGRTLLTIIIPSKEVCPNQCLFVDRALPDWVQFRYVNFSEIKDQSVESDVMFVVKAVRKEDIEAKLNWVKAFRETSGYTVGLYLYADEKNKIDFAFYQNFDYAIRNYFFDVLFHAPVGFHLSALSNITCGEEQISWPPKAIGNGPRFGIYWQMLYVRYPNSLVDRKPMTVWPASKRGLDCTFIGSLRADRALMMKEFRNTTQAHAMNCKFSVEKHFVGSKLEFEYIHQHLAASKFGLNPRGNNPETHRLGEILEHGGIPVMLHDRYQLAGHKPIPGVIGGSWREVRTRMKELLRHENSNYLLDELQKSSSEWYYKQRKCENEGVDAILRLALSSSTK